nr:response regulator [Desulfobacula sp.]
MAPTRNSILVIDDEASVLSFLRLCLSRRGYRVDTAKSGEEGIKKIRANGYSMIITDIKMGSLSGDNVLYYLRDVLGDPTPVIGMSGTPGSLTIKNLTGSFINPVP